MADFESTLGMGLKVTRNFFDREKVQKAMDRKTARVLSKFGAFVRRRAQTSIRKRKTASVPGTPPSSHVGLLRKHIYFAYDDSVKSVVIGPIQLSGHSGQALPALEHGGISTVETVVRGTREKKEIVVQARPFMGPAFAEEQKSSLPKMWANEPFK